MTTDTLRIPAEVVAVTALVVVYAAAVVMGVKWAMALSAVGVVLLFLVRGATRR